MTKNKWVNLLLEAVGCFISALGIYSFAVAAGRSPERAGRRSSPAT